MRIVVTGASGFIGKNIIPILENKVTELLLVGRNPDNLKSLFPQHRAISYETLRLEAKGYDALVHLAVMNNNNSGQITDFRRVNVQLLKNVLNSAREAGVKTFINTTTFHASNNTKASNYAQTKREGEEMLSRTNDIAVVNLRLPAVYGSSFTGRLKFLSKLPFFLRPMAFQIIAALKPTVHVDCVAKEILNSAHKGMPEETMVSDRQSKNLVYQFTKRAIDLGFVFFVIMLLWWVLLFAWMTVKFTSSGPGIFSQARVGKYGANFTCYKFRTMYLGTEQVSTHDVAAHKITIVGKILRKTKIDELPQIWNILKNEMSLVGPRPCLPQQNKLVQARKELGILKEKGGITGWAQIQNVDMKDPDRLAKLDAEYLALRTVPLDLKIILATALGRGQGDKINNKKF